MSNNGMPPTKSRNGQLRIDGRMKWLNGQSPITSYALRELTASISAVRTGNLKQVNLYDGAVRIYRAANRTIVEIKDADWSQV